MVAKVLMMTHLRVQALRLTILSPSPIYPIDLRPVLPLLPYDPVPPSQVEDEPHRLGVGREGVLDATDLPTVQAGTGGDVSPVYGQLELAAESVGVRCVRHINHLHWWRR